eukprot:15147653-Alexandrium_andersonii.AAC.1
MGSGESAASRRALKSPWVAAPAGCREPLPARGRPKALGTGPGDTPGNPGCLKGLPSRSRHCWG